MARVLLLLRAMPEMIMMPRFARVHIMLFDT